MATWCCCCVHDARSMRRPVASWWCDVLFCRLTQKVMRDAKAAFCLKLNAMLNSIIVGQETESELHADSAEIMHQASSDCLWALQRASLSKGDICSASDILLGLHNANTACMPLDVEVALFDCCRCI